MKLFGRTIAWLKADDLLGCVAAWNFLRQKQPVTTEQELIDCMSEMLEEVSKNSQTTLSRLEGGKWQLEGDWDYIRNAHNLLSFSNAMVQQGKIATFALYVPGSSNVEVQTDEELTQKSTHDAHLKADKTDVDGSPSQAELAFQGKSCFERVMVWVNQNVIAQGAAEELLKVISTALGTALHSDESRTQWCLDGTWASLLSAYRTMQYLVVCLSLGQTVSQLVIPQMVNIGIQTDGESDQLAANGMCNNLVATDRPQQPGYEAVIPKTEPLENNSQDALQNSGLNNQVSADNSALTVPRSSTSTDTQHAQSVNSHILAPQVGAGQLDVGAQGVVPGMMPGAVATQPGMVATQPGMVATQSGMIVTQTGTATTQHGMVATQPGLVATQTGVVATQPGVVATQPGVVATQPGVVATQPGVLPAQAGQAMVAAGSIMAGTAQAGLTAQPGQVLLGNGTHGLVGAQPGQPAAAQNSWCLPLANNPGYMVMYNPQIGLVLTPMPGAQTVSVASTATNAQQAQALAGIAQNTTVNMATLQNQQVCIQNADSTVATENSEENKGQFSTIGSIISELSATTPVKQEADQSSDIAASPAMDVSSTVSYNSNTDTPSPKLEIKTESESADSQDEFTFTGEPGQIVCPLCGFVSRTKRGLAEHRRRRHLERPYKCETCLKCFSEEMFLRKHIASSSCRGEVIGESKLVCKICSFVSQTERGLSEHIRRRHLDRPFKCELCSAAFSDLFYLRKHRIEIHNLDLHTCEVCGAEAKTLRSLAEHKSKIHNIRTPKSKRSSSGASKAVPSKQIKTEEESSEDMTDASQMVANWPQLLASAGITSQAGLTGMVIPDGLALAAQANGITGVQHIQPIAEGESSMTEPQQVVFPAMTPVTTAAHIAYHTGPVT